MVWGGAHFIIREAFSLCSLSGRMLGHDLHVKVKNRTCASCYLYNIDIFQYVTLNSTKYTLLHHSRNYINVYIGNSIGSTCMYKGYMYSNPCS